MDLLAPRHRWHRLGASTFICRRCGRVRHDITNRRPRLRHYHYPNDHLLMGKMPACGTPWPEDWYPTLREKFKLKGKP